MQKFCREVVVWRALRHPNILPLIGVVMFEGHFEMLSDWMANGNLVDFINARPDVNRIGLVGFAFGISLSSIFLMSAQPSSWRVLLKV
jgi:serine/threonine protein kinase